MKIKNSLLALLFLLPITLCAQSGYLVGTSKEAIEPDQSLISLHLGGYGAPKDGRFTLHWVKIGALPEVTAISGLNDRLYLAGHGDLSTMNPSEPDPKWVIIGKAENIVSLAGSDNSLYAINDSGELLKTKVAGKINWEKIGSVDKSAKEIAVFRNEKIF